MLRSRRKQRAAGRPSTPVASKQDSLLHHCYITTIGIVNPRFKDQLFFRAPGLLALVVALLTGMALVLVIFVLHSQCNVVCSTVQLPLIKVSDASYCVLLGLTNDMPIFDGVTAAGSLVSSTTFGKCSLLHSQACALRSWTELQSCAKAFDAWVTSAPSSEFSTWVGLMVRGHERLLTHFKQRAVGFRVPHACQCPAQGSMLSVV